MEIKFQRWWAPALALCLVFPATAPAQESGEDTVAAAPETEDVAQAEVKHPRVSVSVSVTSADGRATPLGVMVIELRPDEAPGHVENFLKLVKEEFYVGTTFHRIVPAFIVQGGDLLSKGNWKSSKVGTGSSGPEYTLPAEIGGRHLRGAVAAARKPDAVNPNRASSPSQFYICLADLPSLDQGGYTVFGQVVEGMDVVDKLARVKNTGPPRNQALQQVTMTQVKLLP